MTVRDVRLHWPQAEEALASGGEIVVTRDGRPVARILPYAAPAEPVRARFDPRGHLAWLSRFWRGRKRGPATDELLARDRADRPRRVP
jgi:antitoxin (DNA-binding transcriptional repressor) of toxin-antitoxin stability system